jgi:hypothetical protein
MLCVSYRSDEGDGYDVIDSFGENEQAANAAKDWFYLLLTGEIDKDEWEQGRTDSLAREGIVERKAKPKIKGNTYDEKAYEYACAKADRHIIDFYEDVFAGARNSGGFQRILKRFQKVVNETPLDNPSHYLAYMFEQATGVKYESE